MGVDLDVPVPGLYVCSRPCPDGSLLPHSSVYNGRTSSSFIQCVPLSLLSFSNGRTSLLQVTRVTARLEGLGNYWQRRYRFPLPPPPPPPFSSDVTGQSRIYPIRVGNGKKKGAGGGGGGGLTVTVSGQNRSFQTQR